ncbi:retrotransposon protein, putative, ty1-copia subclass [Tanacetum coccineum]
MDSGGSYHMTPKLDIFFDFLECDRGSVLLGDNGECKIRGIGKVRVKLRDGSSLCYTMSGLFYLEHEEIIAYTLWMAMQWQVSLMLVLKKKIVMRRFGTKDWDISARWGYRCWKSRGCLEKKSRRVWVYILRFKHEAFGKFKQWKQLVENQAGRTVKKLRTNNGLEFCNWEFEQLCIKSGIARHLIVVGTPQQNRLVESIEKKIPMKMWSGHPSDYEMLRIFGCVAYSHVKQGKLEPRAVKYVLLGYPEGVKGYRLYRLDDESPKIVEVELQGLNNHTLEEDHTYQEDGDDENASDQETDQRPDLTDHQLVWDREPRTRTKPLRRDGFSKEEQDLGVSRSSSWAKASELQMRAGIDCNEVFSPIVRHTSIRVILALTACKDYELEQLDVKTTFLHRNLEEVIYMRQPSGYEQGNKHTSYNNCVYYMSYAPGEYMYLLLYADDMLIACKRKAEIGSTKSLLKKEFHMKELEKQRRFLVWRSIDDGKSVQMPLGGHFKLSLKDCPIRDCDVERMSKVPYENAVGSLCLVYGTNRGSHMDVISFVDSDYAKDPDKEYMALTEAVKEAIWLKGLLEELGEELNTVAVNCDNQGAIHLSRNHVFHERTKHINVRYHFIKEVLEAKTVKVLNVGTEHNAADALTKVVLGQKLQHCLELLNVGVG